MITINYRTLIPDKSREKRRLGGGGGFKPGPIPIPLGNIINSASCYSSIVGGSQNCIGGVTASSYPSTYGFIGGGNMNCIDSGTAAGTASCYGVIGGGFNNVVCAGTCYSSVLGGQNNIVCNNWASVSGYGITTAADCTFHVNCLNACNTPGYSTLLPGGTIYYVPITGTPPVGAKALYII